MTFQASLPYQFQGFRQTLTPEQIIRNQIEKCIKAFSENDRDLAEASVKALTSLVTGETADEKFVKDLAELKSEWDKEVAKKEKERQRLLLRARHGCPDLVPKASPKPNMDHLIRNFRILLNLFERKKMWLKPVVEDSTD